MRISLDNFTGGLVTARDPENLAANELQLLQNMRLDPSGPLTVRAGSALAVALPGTTLKTADLFYSATLDLFLCARESAGTYRLFTRPGDLSGSWTDRGQIASANTARTTFCEWPGTTRYCIVATDTSDATNGGIYTLDSTPTLTKRLAANIVAVAVWQNKVWAAEHVPALTNDSVANSTRLDRSAAGDPTTWGDFIDLRDKDGSPLQALGTAAGALVAFKRKSAYRITDSSTGAYTMIDSSSGCYSPRSVGALGGRLYTWGVDGMYSWDGIGAGKRISQDKILIAPQGGIVYLGSVSAGELVGIIGDRVIFASGSNLFEYYPHLGAFTLHVLASSELPSSLAAKGGKLYGAFSVVDNIYDLFATEGDSRDNGVAFSAFGRTRPFSLGVLARLQRLRVYGWSSSTAGSTKTIEVIRDRSNVAESYDITTSIETTDQEELIDLRALGHSEFFEVRFVATGSNTTGFADRLNRLILDLTPLGRGY